MKRREDEEKKKAADKAKKRSINDLRRSRLPIGQQAEQNDLELPDMGIGPGELDDLIDELS